MMFRRRGMWREITASEACAFLAEVVTYCSVGAPAMRSFLLVLRK